MKQCDFCKADPEDTFSGELYKCPECLQDFCEDCGSFKSGLCSECQKKLERRKRMDLLVGRGIQIE